MALDKTLHNSNHEIDPKQDLLAKLGDISRKRISGAQVLVATYVRPRETKSGWQRSDEARKEDIYQGKVGLIVKMGPQAAEFLDVAFGEGEGPGIGDWVYYRIHDGFMLSVNGHECRQIEAKHIRGSTDGPDDVL